MGLGGMENTKIFVLLRNIHEEMKQLFASKHDVSLYEGTNAYEGTNLPRLVPMEWET